eukprot:scaffold10490_cov129-Cylindrotheca_fusiformis.AAC.11
MAFGSNIAHVPFVIQNAGDSNNVHVIYLYVDEDGPSKVDTFTTKLYNKLLKWDCTYGQARPNK